MKILIIILLCVSCSFSSTKKKRYKPRNHYTSKKIKHFNCVKDLNRLDVDAISANSICIDIFRKDF